MKEFKSETHHLGTYYHNTWIKQLLEYEFLGIQLRRKLWIKLSCLRQIPATLLHSILGKLRIARLLAPDKL